MTMVLLTFAERETTYRKVERTAGLY